MQRNIILAGVGGQGILSVAYVIDNAALASGYHFKQAEVHGMAQRGGAVQSHLRFSDAEIYSDLVPTGKADLVISVEPLEVMRYWHYLRPGGAVVASVTPYVNIPDYPGEDELLAQLASFGNVVLVDSAQLAKAAGNLRTQNMVVVGAAAPLLGLAVEHLEAHVASLFAGKGDKIVAVNLRAFALGRTAGLTFRALVDAGLPPLQALALCRATDPDTLSPDHAGAWAATLGADAERLASVVAGAPLDGRAVPAHA